MTKALRKKEVRKPAAALCRWAPFGPAHAGERVSLITEPQFILLKTRRHSEEVFPRSQKIATIRLQWNPKPKMIEPDKIFDERFQNFTRLKRQLPQQQ
jgi:hypothetical protein